MKDGGFTQCTWDIIQDKGW